jgi:hypothetical protein
MTPLNGLARADEISCSPSFARRTRHAGRRVCHRLDEATSGCSRRSPALRPQGPDVLSRLQEPAVPCRSPTGCVRIQSANHRAAGSCSMRARSRSAPVAGPARSPPRRPFPLEPPAGAGAAGAAVPAQPSHHALEPEELDAGPVHQRPLGEAHGNARVRRGPASRRSGVQGAWTAPPGHRGEPQGQETTVDWARGDARQCRRTAKDPPFGVRTRKW